jgi:hypothetical protein
MTASKVNPRMWDGEERSGGYIAKNAKPVSASSPDFKGKIYLAGVGWYWLSGWLKPSGEGEILALRVQEMTDEQAAKFCKAEKKSWKKAADMSERRAPQHIENGADSHDSGIPF